MRARERKRESWLGPRVIGPALDFIDAVRLPHARERGESLYTYILKCVGIYIYTYAREEEEEVCVSERAERDDTWAESFGRFERAAECEHSSGKQP